MVENQKIVRWCILTKSIAIKIETEMFTASNWRTVVQDRIREGTPFARFQGQTLVWVVRGTKAPGSTGFG